MLPFDPVPLRPLLNELDEWRARLDARWPLVRTWEGRLRHDLEVESIAASTAMEGISVTANDVRRIFAHDTPRDVSAEDAAFVLGYREAMRFVLQRADDLAFRWDRGLCTNLHDRVMASRYAEGAGRFRLGGTSVIDRQTGLVVFEPPETGVAEWVDQIAARMNDGFDHPALGSAWIHVALAAVHPFRDGNGRTARITASLAMYRGGFKRPEFCSLEEWWGRHLPDYYGAFACLGRKFDPEADVSPFVAAHLAAQVRQVRELELTKQADRRIWLALESVCTDRGLPERLANALWDAFHGRIVTAATYKAGADVSRQTVTVDLRTATAAGLLTARGERGGRHYRHSPQLFPVLSQALGLELPPNVTEPRQFIAGQLAQRIIDSGVSPAPPFVTTSSGGTSVVVQWGATQTR